MKTTIVLLLALIGVASATFKFKFRRCSRPTLPNGSYWKKHYYYYKGSVISYKCNPGYYYKGTPKATCKYMYGKFTWVPYPKCYPVQCKVPQGPAMGSVTVKPGTYVKVGTLIRYDCKEKYLLVGSPTAKCLSSGKFSSPVPLCVNRCEVPEEPDNGSVDPKSGTLVKIGTTVKYSCDEGFDLVGSATAKCMGNGKFSSKPPTCEEVKCTVPAAPAGGSVSPSEGEEVSVGDSIHYSCQTNFKLVGMPSAKCKANGQFSSPTPSCQPLKKPCKRPYTAPGIKISPDYKHLYPHGTKVKHTCKYGQLVGSYELYCENGKWIGTPPTCQVIYY